VKGEKCKKKKEQKNPAIPLLQKDGDQSDVGALQHQVTPQEKGCDAETRREMDDEVALHKLPFGSALMHWLDHDSIRSGQRETDY
jgi:hypothetical protein